MKWIKRISFLLFLIFVAIATVVFIGYRMSRVTPQWYRRAQLSEEDRRRAAQSALNALANARNWAADAQAREIRLRYAAAHHTTAPVDPPPGQQVISLSDDQIEAFLSKWSPMESGNTAATLSRYVDDPQVVIHNGRLIIAARPKDSGVVMSAHFIPSLDPDGRLNLHLEKVMAGNLPMPSALYGSYLAEMGQALKNKLPEWRAQTMVNSDGTTNGAGVAAAMGMLLANAMGGKPSEPILFLPGDVSLDRVSRAVPVKVAGVSIDGNTLSMTLDAIGATERADVIERIRSAR